MVQVDLRDAELATHLALTLTDFEFEMLLRRRIEFAFEHVLQLQGELDSSHNRCVFIYKWEDKCEWSVSLGSTYSDRVNIEGEVLSISVSDAYTAWSARKQNRLSILLPPPKPE